ncbi:MAG TPA: hypothetical protein VN253_06200 [Kofleriaceae bacterium]|nr:hypothetical protein [Kofleriaceae bacterium]
MYGAYLAASGEIDTAIEELDEELEALDRSIQSATVRPRTGEQLIADLAATSAEFVFVDARLFVALDWGLLDRRRSSLAHAGVLILITTFSSFDELMQSAPNLASWLGAQVFAYVRDGAGVEVARARRLDALRTWASKSDADIIHAAEDGTLPRDPEFAEWLVLLGRGDLLGPRGS